LVTKLDFTKQNPRAIKKVLRALIKAQELVQQNLEEAKQAVADFIKIDRATLDKIWDISYYRVTLDQSLLTTLEDQTRWAQKYGLTKSKEMPNYLDVIYFAGLEAVRPMSVRIIR
jgi:sulfonate transport system substrate-binding protein